MSLSEHEQPLQRVRVVEMGSMISVPYAAMMLAELGAEVIKVEPPIGDQSRHGEPRWKDMAAYFYNLNRGKRSAVIDLKQAEGISKVRDLIGSCDVVMENWRPGVARKLGLDFDTLRRDNPRLITASVRGYGESGPYANDRVYDPIVQGVSSMAHGQGGSERPELVRTYLPDKLASLATVQGILAALYKRERTRSGSHVAISMLDAAIGFLWPDGMLYHTFPQAERDPELMKRPGPRVAHMLRAGDAKWFVCTAVTEEQWQGLCGAVSATDLVAAYPTGADRKRYNPEISEALNRACSTFTREELLDRLRRADVPCGPVNTVDQMVEDPQVRTNGSVREVERDGLGVVREAPPIVRIDGAAPLTIGRAPYLGEHTQQIEEGIWWDQGEDVGS